MSRMPSIKTLEAAFPGKGAEIRALLKKERTTMSYESVKQWVNQCYHKPRYIDRLLLALNEILEGHGVEPIWGNDSVTWPIAEYVNMGDTYNTTILYDRDHGTIQVTCLGDWIERNERRVKE